MPILIIRINTDEIVSPPTAQEMRGYDNLTDYYADQFVDQANYSARIFQKAKFELEAE